MKTFALPLLVAPLVVVGALAGCASYTERVVERPVPATTTTQRTVVTEVPPGPPTAPPMTVTTTRY